MDIKEKISKKQRKKLIVAERDLQKLNEEIAPFVKRRKFKRITTAGTWKNSSENYNC